MTYIGGTASAFASLAISQQMLRALVTRGVLTPSDASAILAAAVAGLDAAKSADAGRAASFIRDFQCEFDQPSGDSSPASNPLG